MKTILLAMTVIVTAAQSFAGTEEKKSISAFLTESAKSTAGKSEKKPSDENPKPKGENEPAKEIKIKNIKSLGGQEGNGGAGVINKGQYMTFYSAGFFTEPASPMSSDVPGLEMAADFINGLYYLPSDTKAAINSGLLPTTNRKYFAVKRDQFDDQTRDRLLAEYVRVKNLPTKDLVIYAITDTATGNTYLLPEFFALHSESDQAAILFHEAYWMIHPNSTYNDVVSAEMAFQSVMAKPQDASRVLNLLNFLGGIQAKLSFAYRTDVANKALVGFAATNGSLNLWSLLGNDFRDCAIQDSYFANIIQTQACLKYTSTQMYVLKQRYPNSLLIRLILSEVPNLIFGGGSAQYNPPYDINPTKINKDDCIISLEIDVSVKSSKGLSGYCRTADNYNKPIAIGIFFKHPSQTEIK